MQRGHCSFLQRLNALKPLAKNAQCAALEPSNVEKNRIIEIIPSAWTIRYLTFRYNIIINIMICHIEN